MLARALLFSLLLATCSPRPSKVEPPPAKDAPASAPIVLETSEGRVRCELDGVHAPQAVAMIVGLVRGSSAWRDPRTGDVVRRPYYDDLAFFRAIPGVLVQTGCPVGDGSGTPGYRLPLETRDDDAARLARPGVLLLAHYQAPPGREDPNPPAPGRVIGSQIVIGLVDMSHLAGQVTVVGACTDLEVVARIAQAASSGAHARLVHTTAP